MDISWIISELGNLVFYLGHLSSTIDNKFDTHHTLLNSVSSSNQD